MQAMQEQPAREVAFDGACMAGDGISTAEDKEMRARVKSEVSAALKAHEVKPGLMARAGAQRIVETFTLPQLVAGNARHRSNVGGDALLELHAFLQVPVLVADEAPAKEIQIQAGGFLK